jgi:pyruvate-formate lyase-activating enzyme
MKLQKSDIAAINKKQIEAITLAVKRYNRLNIDLDLATRVCRSKVPRNDVHSLPYWESEEHEALWKKMQALSVEELAQDFGNQISNPRILEYYVPEDEM